MNVGDVGEEGDGRQVVHRAGEEILLTAVLLHQGEGLIRVKEHLIGCYEENTRNHALKKETAGTYLAKARKIVTKIGFVTGTHFPVGDEATEQLQTRQAR